MKKIQTINAIYLALAPILAVYMFSNGIQLYFVLVLLLFILNLLLGNIKKAIMVRKNELQWYSSIVIIGLFGYIYNINSNFFNTSLFINNFIALTIFFVALIICTSNYNARILKKTLLIFGITASVVCILQRAQLLLTGSFYKDVFLPGLEVMRDLDTFSTDRVSAFFTEPAHLSIYLIPIYYIELYDKNYLNACFICLGILFSGSTTGLLLVLLLSVYYIIRNTHKKIYILYSLIGISIIYSGIMFLFPDVLINNIEKINAVDTDSVRLLGPLFYLDLFDGFQLCFGIGLNQLSDFLQSNGIYVENEWGVAKNANYANAVIYSILSYGFLGLYFFVRYLIKAIKVNKTDFGFVIYTIGILFSDQILFNMNFLYILTFLVTSQIVLSNNENIIYNK